MFMQNEIELRSRTFVDHPVKKVLLFISKGTAEESHRLRLVLEKENRPISYLDLHLAQSIEEQLSSISNQHILIISGVGANGRLDNLIMKNRLDQRCHKIIVFCHLSLLDVRFDPGLYFAPIKNGRILRHLLITVRGQEATLPKQPSAEVNVQLPADLPQVSNEQHRLLHHFLNQKLMTHDIRMMQMLAQRVVVSATFRKELLDIIYAAQANKQLQVAAANALTIFRYAKVSLANLDLHNVCAPGSNLSGMNLDNTNCSGMDLQGSDLSGTWLREANMVGANLIGVKWGEFPTIPLEDDFYDCVFSHDGKWLAVVIGEGLRLLPFPQMNSTVLKFEEHDKNIIAISFSGNDELIATGSEDGVVVIFNIALRRGEKRIKIEMDKIHALAFDPLWRFFAVAAENGDVVIFSMSTGEKLYETRLEDDDYRYASINFSADGELLACGARNLIEIIDTNTYNKITIANDEDTEYGDISAVVFNGSRHLLAVGRENCPRVNLYDTSTGDKYRTITAPRVKMRKIVFTPDDRVVAWGSEDGIVRAWEVESGALFNSFAGHSEPIQSLSFSPDGQFVAAGARSMLGAGNRDLKVWQVASTKQEKQYGSGHRHRINSISFSPSHQLLATHSNDAICLWRLNDGSNIPITINIPESRGRIASASFHPSGDYLVIGDRKLYIWDVATNSLIRTIEEVAKSFIGLAFAPDGKTMAVATVMEGAILINIETGEALHHFKAQGTYGYCRNVSFSSSGDYLVTTYFTDATIFLWEVATGKLIRRFDTTHKTTRCNVDVSADGKYVASAGMSLYVELWTIDAAKPISLVGHSNFIRSVAFSPSGEYLAASSEDGSIRIWNVETRQCVGCVRGIVNGIDALRWIVNDQNIFLATGGEDSTLRLWQLFRETSGQLKIVLKWSTRQEVLNADCALIGNAAGLTPFDKRLLMQAGAFNSTRLPDPVAREQATQELLPAVMANDVVRVKRCLEDGACPNICDDEGNTPIKVCVTRGFNDVLELLIIANVDVFHADIANNNWLHMALKQHQRRIAEQLLAAGINPNKANYHGTRPIHLALTIADDEGDVSYLEVLITAGADPNKSYSKSGETLVHIAATMNWISVLKLCLQHGGDVKAKTKKKITPLHAAALGGHLGALKLLLERSPDIDAQGKYGETALNCAAQHGQLAIVTELLSHGANTELCVEDGRTPLLSATLSTHSEVVQALLQRGASVKAKADGGFTALHIAVSKEHRGIIADLIAHGADVNAISDNGISIMGMALRTGDRLLIAFLKMQGSQLTQTEMVTLLTRSFFRSPSPPVSRTRPEASPTRDATHSHDADNSDDEKFEAARSLSRSEATQPSGHDYDSDDSDEELAEAIKLSLQNPAAMRKP